MERIRKLEKRLEKEQNELNKIDDKIAEIEGVPDEVTEIRESAESFTSNIKKRPRPNYKENSNEEHEERNKKRQKRKFTTPEIMEEEDSEEVENEKVKKGKKLDRMIEELNMINEKGGLDEIIEREEKINNEQQVETEDLVIQLKEIEIIMGLAGKTNQIEMLKRYNYAESFRMRIRKEMKNGMEDQTARTKVYKEINEIMGKSYTNLKKMTQQAEKLYKLIKETGGRKIIKNLEVTKMSTMLKLTREQILYVVERLERKESLKI